MMGKAVVFLSIYALTAVESSIPDDFEKLVCEVATQKQIEDKATAEVCKVITEKFPAIKFQPNCPTLVESLWDHVAAQCPKKVTAPNPEIEKLICEVATQKQIEDKATAEVCKVMTEKFPAIKFQPDCPAALEMLWDHEVAALCPKKATAPIPEIEKLICEVATQKQIEDKATAEVCKVMTEKFPAIKFQPDCPTAVQMLWDHEVAALCPKKATAPIPEIEKLICEVATEKQIEDKATAEVCKVITEKFPAIKFQPDCSTDVEMIWNHIVAAHCPKNAEDKVIMV